MVERSLDVLREQGCVDDARYARLLGQDKRELESWGHERIRRTLLARGVERELIDEALRTDAPSEPPGTAAPPGELGRALQLLRRRFPSPPGTARERERALGVLLRKGYESEVALEALARHNRDSETDGILDRHPGDPDNDSVR